MNTLLLLLALLVQGAQIPPPVGMVNDFANVIPQEQQVRMERLAEAVRSASGGEIAVVTLNSIDGRDPGMVALEIGRSWGVGGQGRAGDPVRNAGVVILVSIQDRAVSVQVGSGAEGFITDGTAGEIRREATPLLRQERYGDALELMETRVAQRFAQEFSFSLDSALLAPAATRARPAATPAPWMGPIFPFLVILVIWLVVVYMSKRGGGGGGGGGGRRRRRRQQGAFPIILGGSGWRGGGGSWGGGGGGGAFGGGGFGGFGGGGGFSGGGSSGRW